MTFQICHADGRIYNVHTEVGEGLTKVVFKEASTPAPAPVTGAAA